MRNVLIPLDGSEPSERALDHATETLPDASIILLSVIDPSAGFGAGAGAPGAAEVWYNTQKERMEGRLQEASDEMEDRGMSVETAIETGRPSTMIIKYAEDNDVDHIIMGSHGREGVSRLLLGSVAERVIRRASVPVTVVR